MNKTETKILDILDKVVKIVDYCSVDTYITDYYLSEREKELQQSITALKNEILNLRAERDHLRARILLRDIEDSDE